MLKCTTLPFYLNTQPLDTGFQVPTRPPSSASLKPNEGGANTMYAVIETGGKQLRVEVGQSIFVEKLDVEEGAEVVFEKV